MKHIKRDVHYLKVFDILVCFPFHFVFFPFDCISNMFVNAFYLIKLFFVSIFLYYQTLTRTEYCDLMHICDTLNARLSSPPPLCVMPRDEDSFVFDDGQGDYEAAAAISSNPTEDVELVLNVAPPVNRPRLVFGPSDD